MKLNKIVKTVIAAAALVFSAGFKTEDFSITAFKNYEREFKSKSIGACSSSSTKTYEDYRMITDPQSRQYRHIHTHMTVDDTTGFLYDEDGFIGVALGYQFGEIGTRYYIVLDTGIILPVVKIDAKAAVDATDGCSANLNASVIEFVIDSEKAYEYFGGGNGLVNNGNYNNYTYFNGRILDFELVLDEKLEDGVTYDLDIEQPENTKDYFEEERVVQGGY
ncbi:MAG: hypothetical protein IJJ29_10300 [Solobacterium sp.]|nr:hypothetical protein [Solobacterium sp.]